METSTLIDAIGEQKPPTWMKSQQRRLSTILVEQPKSTLNALFGELNRLTGFSRNQILLFTFGLISGCALLGPFIQLLFIAMALLWPIHSSIRLLCAIEFNKGNAQQNDRQISQKLSGLLAYWTIFALQSIVLDHLLGALLRPLLLYWPAKLAFVAFLLMAKWEANTGDGDARLFQTMLTTFGNFLAANLPFKLGGLESKSDKAEWQSIDENS